MGLVIGTAGHIDHGKTTLVRALTGIDTDRLKEEKQRGLSIELGFAHMEVEDGVVSFVDVPGHERFIRNMLAGVGGIDCVLLCVACDDGVMPQTIEHLEIVSTLGIEKGIFVLTKADTVSADRIEEVKRELEGLARGTTLEGSPVVVVSAHRRTGLDSLKEHIITLYRTMEKRGKTHRWMRLPIDRVFPVKGFGCVVTGTLVEGTIRRADRVCVFPSGREVKVRGLQTHHRELDLAEPHSRVAVNLSGISHRETRRGEMLVCSELYRWLRDAVTFDCIIESSRFAGRPLKNNSLLKLHCFTTEATVRVRLMEGEELPPGMYAPARVFSRTPLPLAGKDRFILRDPSAGRTTGGGRVVISYPSGRSPVPLKDVNVSALKNGDVAGIVGFLVKRRADGVEVDALSFMLNVDERRLLEECSKEGIECVGGRLLLRDTVERLCKGVLEVLAEYHRGHPEKRGLHQEELRDRAGLPQTLKDALLEMLVRKGSVKIEGAFVRLPDHSPSLKGQDAEIARWLLSLVEDGVRAIRQDGLAENPFRREDTERVLRYLTEKGELVKLREGVYMKTDTIHMAMDKLKWYIKERGGIRPAEFRDLLGCGRRLAIELLEYFDRRGITIRRGDVRRLLGPQEG